MSKTKKITLSAIMVAMSTVLALVSKIIPSPWLQGGSVTLASMVPIVIVSVMIDWKWGLLSGIVYSGIQMMIGFYPPPTQSVLSFFLVIVLDYVAAFGVIGIAGVFYNLFGRKKWAVAVSGTIVATLRYVCHILSGLLIWDVYAWEGYSVLGYSVIYNGTYMLPEIIITTVALALITPIISRIEL